MQFLIAVFGQESESGSRFFEGAGIIMADPETPPSRPPLLSAFQKLKAGHSVDTIDLVADEVDSMIEGKNQAWAREFKSAVDAIDLDADENDSFVVVISSPVEVGVEVNTTQATSPETTSPVYAYEEASLIEEDNGGPISRYGVYNSWTPPPRWSEPSRVFRWAEGL